ncbi:MAG: methyltransferase domain-containing protein [Bifidobacteriaceae bacterium]|jgi:ubiquinone/menaquinone biosynthesis C-methylase UbiE|nr:methyltransferase domain-containing protein [Bifidobacteriaceae bacterium]
MDHDHDVYTHGHEAAVLASHTWRTVENSAAYLIPELKPGLSLLDVGAGPGTITCGFAKKLAPGQVIGLDRDEGIVEQAAVAPETQGLDNLSFMVGDVYSLPFPDGTFDIVHCSNVLQHLTDPVAALKEMARVAKPGGLVAARESDYGGMVWAPAVPEMDQWRDLYCRVARHNNAEPDAGRFLLGWAHAAGFTDVTPSSSTWCYATPELTAWWGGLWAARTEKTAFGREAKELGWATQQGLNRIGAGWRRWAADPDAWISILLAEIIARV